MASVRVIDISTDELRVLVEGAVATALRGSPSTRLTPKEAGRLARVRPNTVTAAALSGALPAASENPDRKGRSPRFLFERSAIEEWMRAGMPVHPPRRRK